MTDHVDLMTGDMEVKGGKLGEFVIEEIWQLSEEHPLEGQDQRPDGQEK